MAQLLTRARPRTTVALRRSGQTGTTRDSGPAPSFATFTPRADELHPSPQFNTRFDPEHRALWMQWTPSPRPCFNLELLGDITRCIETIVAGGGRILHDGQEQALEYTIMTSATPGVFNMGGDLDLFARLIQTRNRAALIDYGRICIDVLYQNLIGFGHDITTVALVQGECLGGGFEGALSNEIIIAEEGSRFGFPEILFNMFPGMGAYSMLLRRVGRRVTDQVICSGERYSAREMLDLGVIDAVVPAGEGAAAVRDCICRRQRNRNGLLGVAAARRVSQPLPYDELLRVVEIWADRALRLGERDLKLMQRLAARQRQ